MRVVVTRPAAQAAVWVDALAALGCDAVALPLIAIDAVDDVPGCAALHAAWATLPQRALAMFVSANAVEHFFAAAPPNAAGWPHGVVAACTGPGTSAALVRAGVPAAAIVEPPADAAQFDSEALWARLAEQPWHGRSVLVVRGDGGRDWFAQTLRDHGASVDFVTAYRRAAPQLDAAQRALLDAALAQPAAHAWLFGSSEAVQRLAELAPGADWSRGVAWATHPRIAAAARAAGFGAVDVVASSRQAVAERCRGDALPADAPTASVESPPQ